MKALLKAVQELLGDVPVDKVKEFEKDFLNTMELEYPKVLEALKQGQLTEEVTESIELVAKETALKFKIG